MSLGSAAAAAIMLEILCKLISPYQHGSSHPHKASPTTLAAGCLKCVLRTPNVGFGYLLLWKRQGEGCIPRSEQKALRFEVATSSLAELGLGLHCSSSSCTCELYPYHRQLCNTSRAQLSTSNPWSSERRRDLLAPWTQGLRAWCDLVLPADPLEEGFFPVRDQSLQRRCTTIS